VPSKSKPRTDAPARRKESVPTWRNTTPRANPETDRRDLDRGRERWEMVLGR